MQTKFNNWHFSRPSFRCCSSCSLGWEHLSLPQPLTVPSHPQRHYQTGKAMAPHPSALAWKIQWTEEPGGLLSMGSHRVGHDWSDLAAAAAATTRTDCLSKGGVRSVALFLTMRDSHESRCLSAALDRDPLDVRDLPLKTSSIVS